MWMLILMLVGCLSGFFLFRKNTLTVTNQTDQSVWKLSIIIPARNEECNLPHLLESLKSQTVQPFEIIVVDDYSDDRTKEIAEGYGVKVISNSSLLKAGQVRTGRYGMDICMPLVICLYF